MRHTAIERMMTDCVRLQKTAESDGMFGHNNQWTPTGDPFPAAIIRKQDQPESVAEQPTHHEEYTVVVYTGTALRFGEAIRREKDGAVFRILGDVRDTEAPEEATLHISKTSAERWDPE